MKEIKLTQGKVALVDDEDYEYLDQWKWRFSQGYAVRYDNYKKICVLMHREILNVSKYKKTDHKDHNTLNNQKCNLREASHAENMRNRKSLKLYKGIYKKRNGKFAAQIRVDHHKYNLGVFISEKEAALAYNEAALKYHKDFAYINNIL